jgi:hypothetical protein
MQRGKQSCKGLRGWLLECLRGILVLYTVNFPFEPCLAPEPAMQTQALPSLNLRHHYRPEPDRLPRWLRRLWVWF